jgi:RND family efflux transporter MFP subunit
MAGKVDSSEKVDIAAKTSGKVAAIKVDAGSIVSKGDILLTFDAKDKEALVRQAEAGINSASANVASTSANYENVRLNYERTAELYESGAVSKQALDTAETQLKTAEAQKEAAEAQASTARSQLDIANMNLSDTIITAPVAGTIAFKKINVGEMATAGATLLSIVNSDSLYINAYLPARLSGEVKPGQKVLIGLSEIPGKLYEGEITAVNTVVDPASKSIQVKAVLLENDPAIKVGMLAEIALKEAKDE